MKIILSFVVLFFAGMFAQAQQAHEITHWNISVNNPDFKIGDEIEIVIKCTIEEGWHLYSSDFAPDCGPIPTTINFENNNTLETKGEIQAVNSHKSYDDLFECDIADFSGKGVFTQKIKVKALELNITSTGSYQVCKEDGICLAGKINFNEVNK